MARTMEAAFFDLDRTVISRSSSSVLGRPMYRAGMVSRSQFVRGAYEALVYHVVGADERRMERIRQGLLSTTRGWRREQVERIARDVLVELIDPYIYQEAIDLMALHRAEGRRIFIVSSSPEEIVQPLAEHLGNVRVIATRAAIEDGRYTGELAFYCGGENKAIAMRETAASENLDLSRSYAYSDSVTDVPMLEAVGHPVAVNPDRDLRRIAGEQGWPVRDFRRPIRLSQRLAASVPRPAPAVAGALALAAVVAVLGWAYARPRRA